LSSFLEIKKIKYYLEIKYYKLSELNEKEKSSENKTSQQFDQQN
jgi:hypothetical protein